MGFPRLCLRGESYGRRGKGDWHVPAGIQEEEPDAEGFVDGFSKNENYEDTFGQCMDKAIAHTDYVRKAEA